MKATGCWMGRVSVLLLAAACQVSFAQTLVATRIVTVPPGLPVNIDGVRQITPVNLIWLAGSKHTLQANVTLLGGADDASYLQQGVRYGFSSWTVENRTSTQSFASPIITMSPDPDLVVITANFSVAYRLRVSYFNCAGSFVNGICPASLSPGTVTVGGAIFTADGEVYLSLGPVPVNAFANPGWTFIGWFTDQPNSTSFIGNFNVTGPTTIYPRFAVTRRVQIDSIPSGLQVLADRTPVNTPHTIEWGRGTTHELGVVRQQNDNQGRMWIFDSWEDSGPGETRSYTVPQGDSIDPPRIVARFVPGETVVFFTNPLNLKVNVDGRSNYLNYNFAWGVGSTHTFSAPLRQQDSLGRTWIFKSWSNGGPADQTLVVPSTLNGGGLRLTANYEPESRITITSTVPNISISVDGQSCALPCLLTRDVGAEVHLSAPTTIPQGEGARLDFLSWGDSTSPDRTIIAPQDPVNYRVSYQLRYRLITSVEPPEGGRITVIPDSADGYHAEPGPVQIRIEANAGFRFINWDGDASGALRQIEVVMSGPRSVRAVMERIPVISADGARNAAAVTPDKVVAPGSVVAITGINLAPDFIRGPESPLAEAIADVTVRMAGRLLPLFYVAPERINVLLPPDTPEGTQRLTVRWEGKPETSTDVTVVRNAPGIWVREVDHTPYGFFFHQDGTLLTETSRARLNEVVNVLTTGAGPYQIPVPFGFAAPSSPQYLLVDAVDVFAGDTRISPTFAGAAEGNIGLNVIKFRITRAEFPAGSNTPVKVRSNGRESNTVLLPVE